jgi:hypothetical protein
VYLFVLAGANARTREKDFELKYRWQRNIMRRRCAGQDTPESYIMLLRESGEIHSPFGDSGKPMTLQERSPELIKVDLLLIMLGFREINPTRQTQVSSWRELCNIISFQADHDFKVKGQKGCHSLDGIKLRYILP